MLPLPPFFRSQMATDKRKMVGGKSSTRTRTYYFRRCKGRFPESIPDELLFEILVRLPAQDIYFGARLVCRKWYHMTRTKYFIHKHHEHASYGLLYSEASNDTIFIFPREDGGGIGDTYKLNSDYNITMSFWSSCNALTLECHSDYNVNTYCVTNVWTGQRFRLPPCPYKSYILGLSGIGYDATSMTYKVVVTYPEDSGDSGCVILTMGVDKSWRIIRSDHLSQLGNDALMTVPIITEGFVHWNRLGGTEVVTLNLETEIIAETSPPFVDENTYKCCCLSTGRSLTLFLQPKKLVFEIFEMKSETGKWRKLANISLEGQKERIESLGLNHDGFIAPFGWLKYPDVLALKVNIVFIIFYNLISCEISAEKISASCTFATPHKNNLTSFDGP